MTVTRYIHCGSGDDVVRYDAHTTAELDGGAGHDVLTVQGTEVRLIPCTPTLEMISQFS